MIESVDVVINLSSGRFVLTRVTCDSPEDVPIALAHKDMLAGLKDHGSVEALHAAVTTRTKNEP